MCSNWGKSNTKGKPWKKPEEKSTSPIEEQKWKLDHTCHARKKKEKGNRVLKKKTTTT